MKSIGIKLADGSFYPLLEEGNPEKKSIDLTTATDGQTKVHVDVYRSDTGTMEGAEYLDTLEMQNLKPHQTGEPTLDLSLDMDEKGELQAQITDSETGAKSGIQVTLASKGTALPARDANETPFDFDELEGDRQPDEAPSTEDTLQPATGAPNAQEGTPDDTGSSPSFDMSALEQLDEPFDFGSADSKMSPIEEPAIDDSSSDETSDVIREAQTTGEASAQDIQPPIDDFELGGLDELGSTEEGESDLPVKEGDGAQEKGKGLLSAAEAKRGSRDSLDVVNTSDVPPELNQTQEMDADDFDLGGLEQLGDLGPIDNPDESDEQIMVPDSASLVSEIEDIGDSSPEKVQETTTAQEEVAREDTQPAGELTTEELIPVEQIPDAEQANEDSLNLGSTNDESPADDFDLGGLEQLGDLGPIDNPDESDEQIMVPDSASLVSEIEDIGDSSPEKVQEALTSETDVPARENAIGVDQEDETQEQMPPVEELSAAEDVAPAEDTNTIEDAEPIGELAPVGELPTTDETSKENVLPAIDEAGAEEEQPAEELTPEEVAPLEEMNPTAEQTPDEGGLEDLDVLGLDDISDAPLVTAESVDEIDLGDLDDTGAQAQANSPSAEEEQPVDVVADVVEDLPTESELAQVGEGDLEEMQPAENTLPAQEADTTDTSDDDTSDDLGQLNDEPFDFDTTQEEMPTEDTNQDETPPVVKDEDDFGLDELATMDLGSLAELPSDVEDGSNVQEAPDVTDVTSEVETADDFQLPDVDDTGETTSDKTTGFDLPDFNDTSTAQSDTAEDFSLPDFDDDIDTDNLGFSGIFDGNSNSTDDKPNDDLIFSDDDLSLPDDFLSDIQEDSKSGLGDSGGLFNGLDKEGLYDKATLEGGSPSYSEDDDVKSKTKAPVVICVICAIICVLAAALMLLAELRPDLLKTTFFSKNESSKMASLIESVKSESQTQQETAVDQGTQTKPAGDAVQKDGGELSSNTPPPKANDTTNTTSNSQNTQEQAVTSPSVEAKEDQIVVASSPKMVTPRSPEPNLQKAPDVRYKVVWGDTLWDISNAYYRTPWKFRRIASYNGIKDPDKIIAGTWLLLPAE